MANTGTVLLVEDNSDNQIIYSTLLRHLGYEVLQATDGQKAIAIARDRKPDVILMDIAIPLIDGWTATKILKADPETRAIRIVALTAHALPADRQQALEAGCDDYLAKPTELNDVVKMVQRS